MSILEKKESSAVQEHIKMLQGIINRMATNSANCKTWTITILAALLVLVVDGKISHNDLWICYIPVALFFFLDCFYLGLERNFVKKQEKFIKKINDGTDVSADLFAVKTNNADTCWKRFFYPIKNFFCQLWNTFKGAFSFSTLPFYGSIICFIFYLCK
jgi:hypothetical protein